MRVEQGGEESVNGRHGSIVSRRGAEQYWAVSAVLRVVAGLVRDLVGGRPVQVAERQQDQRGGGAQRGVQQDVKEQGRADPGKCAATRDGARGPSDQRERFLSYREGDVLGAAG